MNHSWVVEIKSLSVFENSRFELLFSLIVGQMNFLGEKSSFKISDNPLIQCLDARSVNVKQFFDYLKTDEYRRYVCA